MKQRKKRISDMGRLCEHDIKNEVSGKGENSSRENEKTDIEKNNRQNMSSR